MKIREAKRLAIQNAADWIMGADFDQFWGEDLADQAWDDDALSEILSRAQREISDRVRKLGKAALETFDGEGK